MCRSTAATVTRSCMTRPHRCPTLRYGAAVMFIKRGFQPKLPQIDDEVWSREDFLNFPAAKSPGSDAVADTDLPRRQTALERCCGEHERISVSRTVADTRSRFLASTRAALWPANSRI